MTPIDQLLSGEPLRIDSLWLGQLAEQVRELKQQSEMLQQFLDAAQKRIAALEKDCDLLISESEQMISGLGSTIRKVRWEQSKWEI